MRSQLSIFVQHGNELFSHFRLNIHLYRCTSLKDSVVYILISNSASNHFITALHVMQTRYCDENSVHLSVRLSVCLSVRLSHVCIVTKR